MSAHAYPGIFVSEGSSHYINIKTNATAVPAFMCDDGGFGYVKGVVDASEKSPFARVPSWVYLAKDASFGQAIVPALKAYFENGGGPCYVIKDTSALRQLPDVTLLVAAGSAHNAAVSAFCTKNSSVFGLLDYDGTTSSSTLSGSSGSGGYTQPAQFDYSRGSVKQEEPILEEPIPEEPLVPEQPPVQPRYDPLDQFRDHNPGWGSNPDPYGMYGRSGGHDPYGRGGGLTWPYHGSGYPFGYNMSVTISDGFKRNPGKENCALYGPSLTARDTSSTVPASAVMAGIYCRVDREHGVWKAPANVEVWGPYSVSSPVTKATIAQWTMAAEPVNAIRSVEGRPPLVWGARTLAPSAAIDFRYVPVSRMFAAMERDITAALATASYEPNCAATWERVRGAIDNYLYAIWRRGGLVGRAPEDAYIVQVGLGVTMTQADVANGKMVVRVALVPARPAEFVILHFCQKFA